MPLLDTFAFILDLINKVVVPLVFTIAFLTFIVGIFQSFIAGGDEERKKGRQLALYGIIGFFLMVSVWGLVNVLVGTFGFGGQSRPSLPSFGSEGNGGDSSFDFGDFDFNGDSGGSVGDTCRNSSECAAPAICVINGNTGEGRCRDV